MHAYIQVLVLIPCNMTDTDTSVQVYHRFAIHVLPRPTVSPVPHKMYLHPTEKKRKLLSTAD